MPTTLEQLTEAHLQLLHHVELVAAENEKPVGPTGRSK